jgi:hypothetical protein
MIKTESGEEIFMNVAQVVEIRANGKRSTIINSLGMAFDLDVSAYDLAYILADKPTVKL